MNNRKGIATITIILAILGFIIISSGIYFTLNNNKKDDGVLDTKEQLELALLNDHSAKGEVSINESTSTHLRGTVLINGIPKPFLAIRLNDGWKVVEFDKDIYSCERAIKLNFPSHMVRDCTLEDKDVLTVEQLFLKSPSALPKIVKIIGKVSIPDDGECNCIEITSGGETVIVYIPVSPDSGIVYKEGDTVVVTGTLSSSIDPSSGVPISTLLDSGSGDSSDPSGTPEVPVISNEITITAEEVSEVYPEDDNIEDDIDDSDSSSDDEDDEGDDESSSDENGGNNSDSGDSNSSDNSSNDQSTPSEPSVSSGSQVSNEFYFNILDLDFSEEPIQLIAD